MHGNLEPEETTKPQRSDSSPLLGQLAIALEQLGWEKNDEIVVEIGGSSVYGIPGAGTKWAPTLGTRKYNKDAFIVIKNKSRDPEILPTNPDPNLKQAHPYEQKV